MTPLRTQLTQYLPCNAQEATDRQLMLQALDTFNDCLSRENPFGHFTASAWIVNPARDQVLMVYHNIYDAWSWTGGHADGESDLLSVACREAMEETGLTQVRPLSDGIFSLELLGVNGHTKRGQYISSHVHWNVTYLLEADDTAAIRQNPDENRDVAWFPLDAAVSASSEPWMRGIYQKLNEKLRSASYPANFL